MVELKPIPKEEIIKIIDKFYNDGQYDFIIVLTNGQSICGSIKPKAYVLENESIRLLSVFEQCFSNTDMLELYYQIPYGNHHYSIYIPLEMIAGIHPLQYSEEKIESPTKQHISYVFPTQMYTLTDALQKAKKWNFKIEKHVVFYYLHITKPFYWGKIKFKGDTPLYCDWDFLSKKCGGLNNLGLGTPIIGFSVGWSKSLWSSFYNKVSKTEVKLEKACEYSEVTLSGYVTFIAHKSHDGTEELHTMQMEGANWIGAVVTERKVKTLNDLKKTKWIICYFRENSFMFPLELWERFAEPIKVYGEVVPVCFETEFGKADCFVKVRASAYIKSK
jgi:hypothetical protein